MINMDTEKINQIAGIIRTLNLNIDSVTATQIVESIKPVLIFWVLIDAIKGFLFLAVLVVVTVMAYKLIKYGMEQEYKNNN